METSTETTEPTNGFTPEQKAVQDLVDSMANKITGVIIDTLNNNAVFETNKTLNPYLLHADILGMSFILLSSILQQHSEDNAEFRKAFYTNSEQIFVAISNYYKMYKAKAEEEMAAEMESLKAALEPEPDTLNPEAD